MQEHHKDIYQKLMNSIKEDPALSDPYFFLKLHLYLTDNEQFNPQEKYALLTEINEIGFTRVDEDCRTLGSAICRMNYKIIGEEETNDMDLTATQFMELFKKCQLTKPYSRRQLIGEIISRNDVWNIGLTPPHMMELFQKCDLNATHESNENIAMLVARYNSAFNFNQKELMYIFNQVDAQHKNSKGENLSMLVCALNNTQNLNLTPDMLMSVFLKSNFLQADVAGSTLAMNIIECNQEENLNLSEEQLMNIFDNSDASRSNGHGITYPTLIAKMNASHELHLSPENIYQIFKKTPVTALDFSGQPFLMHVIRNNYEQKLGFNLESFHQLLSEESLGLTHFDIEVFTGVFYLFHSQHIDKPLIEVDQLVHFKDNKLKIMSKIDVTEKSFKGTERHDVLPKLDILIDTLSLHTEASSHTELERSSNTKKKVL